MYKILILIATGKELACHKKFVMAEHIIPIVFSRAVIKLKK